MKSVVTMLFSFAFLVLSQIAFSQTKEDVSFKSGNIELSGTIFLPDWTQGPFATFIIVHGPGSYPRSFYQNYANILNDNGYAVLVYDKRGTGRSDGNYKFVSRRTSHKRFKELSNDVQSAYNFLSNHAKVDPQRIGLFGFSQGGWVVPIVAGENQRLFCSVIVSGPAVSVGEEIFYTRLTGDGIPKHYKNLNFDKITEKVLKYRGKDGFSPIPYISKINSPTLWIYGEKDRSIPAMLSVKTLQDIANTYSKNNFSTKIYPNGDHKLKDIFTNQSIDYFGDVLSWLEKIDKQYSSFSLDD